MIGFTENSERVSHAETVAIESRIHLNVNPYESSTAVEGSAFTPGLDILYVCLRATRTAKE